MSFLSKPIKSLLVMLFALIGLKANSQITYKVTLDADKVTYHVFMKSNSTYNGTQARIGSAQVTILVPHKASNGFVVGNIKGKSVTNPNTNITTDMQWSATRVDAPNENKNFDYISFGFNNSASPVLFDIPANQEIEIISFKNTGSCAGAVSLFENTSDPFKSPNSVNSNPGNSMSIAGFGFGNAYIGNYGGAVDCQATAPDLKITPSGNSSITVGNTYSLSLTAANIGTSATNGNYNVQTTLPVGISYNSSGGANWTCNSSVQPNSTTIVNCQNSAVLNLNESSLLVLSLSAANSLANGTTVAITGNISGGGESNASNNNYSWSPSIINASAPNLTASITGAANISAGFQTSYIINVSNIGNINTSGSYTVNATLPVGMAYQSFSGSGWSVNTTLQNDGSTLVVAQSSSVINANGNANLLTINTLPSVSLTGGTVLTINGTVSGGGDITPANNSFSISSTIITVSKPNLTLSVSGGNSVVAGMQTSFIYTVSNNGNANTAGVYTITTTLPVGLTYNSFLGTGWLVNTTLQQNGTTLLTAQSSTIINIGSNALPLTINVTPSASLANNTVLTINNILSGGGMIGDVNFNFNLTVTKPLLANLVLNITGNTTVISGNPTNYTYILTNNGNGASNGIYTITTTLPAGVTYNSFSGTGWTVIATPQQNGTTIITAQSNTIINIGGQSVPLILNVTPISNANVNLIFNSTVGGGGMFGSTSHTFTINVYPELKPSLTLSIIGQNTVNIGNAAAFTFTVNNAGTAPTVGSHTITATLPVGLTYSSFSGSGWTVTTALQQNGTTLITAQSNNIINTQNSGIPLIINALVANTVVNNTSLIINGTVVGGGANNSNNTASFTFIAISNVNNADLTVNITGSANITPNTPTNYAINVSNVGFGNTAGNYSVNMTIPAGLAINSYSAGSWWTCQPNAQQNGNTILTCQSSTQLNSGSSATPIILNVTPSNNLIANTVLSIYALVSGGGDNTSSNNSFTFNSTVISTNANKPDLTVLISGASIVTPSVQTNYTINVSNIGNATTNGFYSVSTVLPYGLNFNSSSGSDWSCNSTLQNGGGLQVTCQSNTPINAGGNAMPLVLLTTPQSNLNVGTSLVLTSTVSGGGESNASNNLSSITSVVISGSKPSLNIVITGSPLLTPTVSTNYTFTVSNNGTGNTSGNYFIQSYFPAGITYNSSSGTGWTCSSNVQFDGTTKVTCQSSTVVNAGSSAVPLILNVTPNISLVNNTLLIINADVTGGGSTNTTSNFYNFYTQVANTLDLEVKIAVSNKTPSTGQQITYTIDLFNKGTANASNINLLVALPPALSNLIVSQIFNGNSQAANFNTNTGNWIIQNLGAGQKITLTITGTVIQKGVFFASVEVIIANLPDIDSIPNNGSDDEDDLDRVCFSVPITICAGESYKVSIPAQYSNIQWYRNGTIIGGATSNTYSITQGGSYSFTSNTSCPKGGCCDIVVVQGNTPTMAITQPAPSCNTLNLANVAVKINNVLTQVGLTYYTTQSNAQNGVNPLVNTTVNTSGIYWVRYQAFGDCLAVGSITVTISQPNLTVQPVSTCAGYSLSSILVFSNGVQITTGLSYYLTQNDAQNATNPLNNLIVNSTATYWIRYQTIESCFSIASVTVTIASQKPSKPNVADVVIQCPITTANLTAIQPSTPSIVGGKFEWHIANSPTSPFVTNATAVGSGKYYLFEKTTEQCYSEADEVKITINSCCKTTICVPFLITKE